MKNKRNILLLVIGVLILVLGVGYAVVSQVTLNITGTGASKTEDLKVVFDGVNSGTTNGESNKVTAITSQDDSTEATFTVTDMVLNTPVELEFEIQNKESDVNATLALPTITNSKSGFFSVSVSYKDGAKSGSGTYSSWTSGTKTLNHGEKATIKVIVTLTNTPIQETDSTTNIGVSINATPAAGA